MLPKAAVHVTIASVAVPDTVAENCSVPPVVVEEELGVIVTEELADGAFGAIAGFVAEADPAHPDIPDEKLRTKARIALTNTHLKRRFSDTRIM